MKKLLVSILSALMIFSMGCNKNVTSETVSEEIQKLNFDNTISTSIANNFMEALSIGDVEGMKKLSTENIKEGLNIILDKSIKVTGIRLEDASQKGLNASYKYLVSKVREGESEAYLEAYYLKIEKEEKEYKVSTCKSITMYEVFKENTKLKIRKDDEVEVNNVIKMSNIPTSAYSKVKSTDIEKIEIPKDDYGIVGLSFAGNKVAITTINGTNTYVGVVEVDDSTPTAGNPANAGGESENANSSKDEEDKDKLIGKKIITLDIYTKSKVTAFMFSKDDAYVAVNYSTDSQVKRFKFYETGGDIVDLKLDDIFNIDKYNLIYKNCKDNEVYFDVTGVAKAMGVNEGLLGSYKVSTKDFKLTKL